MSAEQRRREGGMLVIGIVLGGLLSIVSGLWTAYYIEWIKSKFSPTDWTLQVVGSSIVFFVVIAFLFYWAQKQLKK